MDITRQLKHSLFQGLSPTVPGSYPAWLRLIWAVILAFWVHAITAEEVTLNLKSADIGTLISTVSEVTGKNFVVDPRVKGKVTVISSRAMEKEELYQVFLSILQVHGFAAVTSGKVIKILPDASAKQSSMPFATARIPGTGDEIVTRVLQVNNVAATQLVPLIRPLVPQQGHLAAYGPTNVLIISDRAANIDRLITIIQRVDQVSDSDIEIIPLEYASATEVVRILTSLAPKTSKGKAAVAQPVLVADERTNSVILSGDRISRLRMRTIISHLDTPLEKTGNTHVVYLHYAKAKEMATILTELSKTLGGEQQGKGKGAGARNEIGIQSDETTNALVITAPHEVFTSIQSVIRQLDIRRSQVMVDAILAEVTLSNLTELGIQWRSSDGTNHNDYVGVNLPGTQSGSLHDFEPLSASLRGLSVGFFRKGTLRALIRALADDSNTNILGKPTLVTLDNEEAEIVVGQNVPFITGQYSNDNSTPDNPFQTIERQDVGVVLKVTPQINEGDSVRLEIFQEISTVDADTSGAGLITNKRSITTSVLVDDGEIVVLGGLIQDELQEDVQKIPLLGDIPVLGHLFRNKRVDWVKTNLMVFLRPQIIRTASDNALITHGKYNYIRTQQQMLEKPSFITPGLMNPQLPSLEAVSEKGVEPPVEAVNEPPSTPDSWSEW